MDDGDPRAVPRWRDLPRANRRIERAILACVGAVALGGWLLIMLGGDTDLMDGESALPGALLWLFAFFVLVPLGSLNRWLSRPVGIDAATARVFSGGAFQGLRSVGVPGPVFWLLPVFLLPIELLLLPIGLATDPVDLMMPVPVLLAILIAPAIEVFGMAGWLLGGLPVVLLGTLVVEGLQGRARGASARLLVGAVLLFGGIGAGATSLALGAPQLDLRSTKQATAGGILALIGLDDGAVVHPVLLWVARASLVAIVVGGVLVARRGRARPTDRPPRGADRD